MYSWEIYADVKATVASLGGDYQLINDSLYENYNSCTNYYDDDMSKTAEALEVMSDNYDIRYQGIKRQVMTEDFSHIPCYYFKRFLAD